MVQLSNQSVDEPKSLAKLVGAVLGERYEIGRMLGEGGMGAVFEGKDLRLGRAVAIKVMQPSYARDAEYTKRFLREAQAASKVRHRNVVVILDYGEAKGGLVYSVMEFLVGQDLEQLLRAQPEQRLPWVQAWGLLLQIASGLKAAHAQGVIHRDIKPANCFLTTEDDEPVVKVVDFGIAKIDDAKQTQQLTGTGNVLGTPSYTAPEMVLTRGPASRQSDVYSLGVVAYRMLTGKLPFTGETAFEVMHHACIHPVPPLREQVGELPTAVEDLVLQMLAKTPEQRPTDMAEIRRRIRALGRLGGVDAPVESTGSSALSLDVDIGSSREVDRTEVLDSGQSPREPSGLHEHSGSRADPGAREPSETPEKGATEVVDAVVVAEIIAEREVLDAGRLMESKEPAVPMESVESPVPLVKDSRWVRPNLGATQPAASDVASIREEPGASKRSRNAGWRVVGAVFVAAVLAGFGWSMIMGGADGPSPSLDDGSDVDITEPEQIVARAEVEVPEPEMAVTPVPEPAAGGGSVGLDDLETTRADPPLEDVKPAAPEKPAIVEAPAATRNRSDQSKPPKARTGPPSDGTLRKRLGGKIRVKCATEIAGQKVTVSFFVTSDGEPSLLTATPKNAAGECAKRQVVGTRFRTRNGETPVQIVVE